MAAWEGQLSFLRPPNFGPHLFIYSRGKIRPQKSIRWGFFIEGRTAQEGDNVSHWATGLSEHPENDVVPALSKSHSVIPGACH
ncbi:hypothetical protein SUGI_1204610 [Cryptomeria japonica]|nr:hypothetical protein SUGI_1204610 [Cryptomeria japonica]